MTPARSTFALRTTILAMAALESRGIEEPRRHLVVVLGHDTFKEEFGTVLARMEPFTDEELARGRPALARVGRPRPGPRIHLRWLSSRPDGVPEWAASVG